MRSVQGREQGPRKPFETTPIRRVGGQGGKITPKSPHSPNQVSLKEERDSVIDAVKLITGAQAETPGEGGVSVGNTPEYDWDTRYDEVQGFPKSFEK